jgi:hypothetical protein
MPARSLAFVSNKQQDWKTAKRKDRSHRRTRKVSKLWCAKWARYESMNATFLGCCYLPGIDLSVATLFQKQLRRRPTSAMTGSAAYKYMILPMNQLAPQNVHSAVFPCCCLSIPQQQHVKPIVVDFFFFDIIAFVFAIIVVGSWRQWILEGRSGSSIRVTLSKVKNRVDERRW